MFDSLSDRLQGAVKRIRGNHKLSEKHIDEMMREIRLSLLEADVNFKVVKEFTKEVKEKAYGDKVLKGLNPSQQVVKIVNDQLKELMGGEAEMLKFKQNPGIIMMAGLQGAGKTTHVGKLALWLRKKEKKKPLLIAADIYRPAAINQLQTIGKQLSIPVFEMGTENKAVDIVTKGLEFAKENGHDLVIIDTAGRLHVDDELMQELVDIKEKVNPDEILLTIDAMTGQDALNVATSFDDKLSVTGCILTKLDGDTRGGAALSIRKVTGVPIKFMGLGEKLDEIDVFHPERMASRILGMGDVLSLVEKVTENIDEDEQMKLMEKMASGKFNYSDLKKQMKMMKRLGSISSILRMVPGMGNLRKQIKDMDMDSQLEFVNIIIDSMTEKERKNPDLIASSSSRRQRIARGSGKKVSDVNKLIDMLNQQKNMMKQMNSMSPEKMQKMQSDMQAGKIPQNMNSGRKKSGKGKGRGGFKF